MKQIWITVENEDYERLWQQKCTVPHRTWKQWILALADLEAKTVLKKKPSQ